MTTIRRPTTIRKSDFNNSIAAEIPTRSDDEITKIPSLKQLAGLNRKKSNGFANFIFGDDEREDGLGTTRESSPAPGSWESAFSTLHSLGDCMNQCHTPCFISPYDVDCSRTQPPTLSPTPSEKATISPMMRSYVQQVSSWDSDETGSEFGRVVGTPKLTREMENQLFRSNSQAFNYKPQKRGSDAVSVDFGLYRSPAWSEDSKDPTSLYHHSMLNLSDDEDDDDDYSEHSSKRVRIDDSVSDLFNNFNISSRSINEK